MNFEIDNPPPDVTVPFQPAHSQTTHVSQRAGGLKQLSWSWLHNPSFAMPLLGHSVSVAGILHEGVALCVSRPFLVVGSSVVAALLIGMCMIAGMLIPFGTLLISAIVTAPTLAGLIFVAVRASRTIMIGERVVSLDDLFAGFKRLPVVATIAGIKLGVLAIASALDLPFLLSTKLGLSSASSDPSGGAGVGLTVLGAMFSVAIGLAVFYAGVRCVFAEVIAIDPRARNPGALDALRCSWRATGPGQIPLLVAAVIVGLLMAGSVALLCVGFVVVGMPLSAACLGAAYNRVMGPIDPRLCRFCGYDLGGLELAQVCPECGGPRPASEMTQPLLT